MLEPLVFLPGLMCDARLFGPQINRFCQDTPVTVAPLTGADRIDALATALIDRLPGKFALVGQGLGAYVAMELSRRIPDRLTRLAFIGAQALAETPQSAAAYEPWIVGARAGRFDEVMREVLRADFLAAGPAHFEIQNQFLIMARTLGPDVFQQQCRAMQRRTDPQAILRRLKCPVMVLSGAEDGCVLPKRQRFLAELIPYAKHVEISGAGHLPTLEQPEKTTQALRDWMAQPLVLRS